jgi:4-hydroxyphenylpyruvate dioxygenase-like putative hemolysin
MRAKLRRVLASGLLGSMTARARPGASNMIGRVQWELIEPLDDKSVYARFLAEKGEGVHHIALAPSSFDQAIAAQAKGERTCPERYLQRLPGRLPRNRPRPRGDCRDLQSPGRRRYDS